MVTPVIVGELDFRTAGELLGFGDEEDAVEETLDMLKGLFWRGGSGWLGPRPDPGDDNAGAIWQLIEAGFVPKNVLLEISRRKNTAILGNQPDWSLTTRAARKKVPRQVPKQVPKMIPNPDPAAAGGMVADPNGSTVDDPAGGTMDDPTGAMVDAPLDDATLQLLELANKLALIFWASAKPLAKMRKMQHNKDATGKGQLRFFWPRALVDPVTGKPKKLDANADRNLEKWAKKIFLEAPEPGTCAVVIDEDTMEPLGVTQIERRDKTKVIELSFLDDNDRTHIVTLRDGGSPDDEPEPDEVEAGDGERAQAARDSSTPLDLGGHATVYQVEGEPLITYTIKRNNMLINLSMTLMGHVMVESGFSELVVTNVELEEEEVDDPTAPGGKRKVPTKLRRGAGRILNFPGIITTDANDGERVAKVDVHKFQPSPLTTFKDGKDAGYRNILEEAQQTHALIAGDATPSGESRIQALADFVMSLLDDKDSNDDAGVWMVETALALIALFAGKPGLFNPLRATFDTKLFLGKLTAEERKQLLSELTARVRSRRNVMMLLGIGEPEAEMDEIDRDEKQYPSPKISPPALTAPTPTSGGASAGA
jgi:hypothetical protein